MSCFCLKSKSHGGKEEVGQQAHVGDFYRLMLGEYDPSVLGDISKQRIESKSDEFNTIHVPSSVNSYDVGTIASKYRQSGIIHGLAPLLHDTIKRKGVLSHIASQLSSSQTNGKDLQNISGRDLFVALALSCSDTVRLYNIASTVPGMSLPLVLPGPGGDFIVLWDAFSDLLALPRGPLIVSIGTVASRGMGKSTLIRQIGLCGVVRSSDPVVCGRTDSPSVDLYFPPSDVVIADCSGFSVTSDPVVHSLASHAAFMLVHVFPVDVSDRSGPSLELKELLSFYANTHKGMIVLIRDVESWKPNCRAMLDAALDVFKTNIAIRIEVHNPWKSPQLDKTAIYKSVYNNIQSVWSKCVKSSFCPSLSILRKESSSPTTASTSGSLIDVSSTLSRELWTLLDEGNSNGRVSTKIFPFSTANTRLLQLKKDERRAREEGGPECESALTLIAKERGSWNAFLASSQPSRVIQWFCNKLVTLAKIEGEPSFSWRMARLANEINECVDAWKHPKIEPLMRQQRDEMDAGDIRAASDTHSRIEELNISIDSFWTELEGLTSPESPWEQAMEADVNLVQQAYAYSVLGGAPVHLLKGTPLRLTETAFLKHILAGGASNSPVLVVSVIGAQSSAKSTLLNFLFGCNFMTRAGRCTRGLYASFLRLSDGRLLVVLDTEGLLSLESSNPGESGDVFDGQMTLLAMACSQVVLINHKGEVSRQLQDLLEVCMFALKHLRVTNFQPDIFFVLRDQHDRSPVVHEDMLRHMKRHLSGCASRLGLKLEDVLRLNASSIHLLPSAYVNQVQPVSGLDASIVNDVFPEEILRLRTSVLSVLSESVSRQPEPWNSLDQWYTHCNSVWETLVQFGHNLLHYRTIREIELKRELAQIASEITKQIIETGFKPEATKLVQQYVDGRLKSSQAAEDLDAADVELRTSLTSLKESWGDKLLTAFNAQTMSQERFSATMREEVAPKMPAVLEYIFDNLMYTWKLHLKQAKDGQQAASMWTHFCDVLDKTLFNDPTRMAVVTESEARSLFAREWVQYEAEFFARMESVKKSKSAVAYEVSVVFNAALGKARHERPDYQLLKEQSPQTLLQESSLMNDKSDDAWRLKYVTVAPGGGIDEVARDIRYLRKLVMDLCTDADSEILRNGQMVTESTVIEWLRSAHDIAYRDGDRRMKTCKVKQPQVLAGLFSDLKQTVFLALVRAEEARQKRQVDSLQKQRKDIEEHLVMMAKGNAGDLDRAASFADRYFKQIDAWLDRQVTAFAAEVRATVLSEMPDPAKAHERAFQQSFGARNWMDVLEYCLDVNAYLEKMFLSLFHRRQVAVIATRLPELEQKLRDMYASLREMTSLWYKEVSLAIANGSVRVSGPLSGGSGKKILDLKSFMINHLAGVGSADPVHLGVVDSVVSVFPPTVNFEIRDVRVFSEAFREQMLSKLGMYTATVSGPRSISARVQQCLQEQSVQAWALIRGCTSRCPLCGSKCDCLGDHGKHSCSHHLFPAFHGWMDRATGAPSLAFCKSEDVYGGTYQCRDGEWRGLTEYLNDSHPSWVPFPRGASSEFDEDVTVLRAAWVNCKFALEKYFTPMKASNPPQWECYVEQGRQLSAADLDTAKKTIRAIRAKTWVPQIQAAMKEAVDGFGPISATSTKPAESARQLGLPQQAIA